MLVDLEPKAIKMAQQQDSGSFPSRPGSSPNQAARGHACPGRGPTRMEQRIQLVLQWKRGGVPNKGSLFAQVREPTCWRSSRASSEEPVLRLSKRHRADGGQVPRGECR